jgi:hypothetical protein
MKLKNYLYEESLAGRLSVVVSTQDITLSTEAAAYQDGEAEWKNEKFVMYSN